MANTDAVSAVCKALVHILRASMAEQAAELNLTAINPTFEVYTAGDFVDSNSDRHVTSGASIFVYRVYPNLSHRTPAGRLLPDGRRQFDQLPLDLNLLITIWGDVPDTQNRLVGWVLRTLEDYPIIPSAVLNIGHSKPIFGDDESVELVLNEMKSEEMFQLWDMLVNGAQPYQVSIPYLVRNLRIDSRRASAPGEPIQIRTLDLQRFDGGQP